MSTWEKELAKQLDVSWGEAKAILQIAKDSMGIDQKAYPEEAKEELFKKCAEVAESFEKKPRPPKATASAAKPAEDEGEN